jgi:rhamnogalacturonyl hydrolase YesR
MKWDWEDAILLHSLALLGESDGGVEFREQVLRVLNQFAFGWSHKKIPEVDRADRCPSALAILGRDRLAQETIFQGMTYPVYEFLASTRRNSLGSIDHLGDSWMRALIPESIWLDSLMMIGVTSVRLGLAWGDDALVDFGAKQPEIYASVLRDPEFRLYRHAWLVDWKRPYPSSATFWLRGNAWIVWALVELLEVLPVEHPSRAGLLDLLGDLSSALLPFQKGSGLWETVINLPGYSYEETSGSAIIASQWLRALRHGYLPEAPYREAALRTWQGLQARLEFRPGGGISVRGISGPTIPGGRLNYKWVREKVDASYGVGPLLLLAAEVIAVQKQEARQ